MNERVALYCIECRELTSMVRMTEVNELWYCPACVDKAPKPARKRK